MGSIILYIIKWFDKYRDGHQNLKLLYSGLNQIHLIGLVERNILVVKSYKSDRCSIANLWPLECQIFS